MTILERQSARKRKSIIYLVEKGEYSLGYALLKVEELYDNGKLTDDDYDYLATWIEELLEEEEKAVEEPIEEVIEEPIEETTPMEEGGE
jgi:hypothetical protein